jgi:superfamily II DNA helicase RecQ
MNAGVSIVVVPYVALMEDIVSRSLEAGIDCFRWLPSSATGRDEQARVAALVVVSADQVMSHEFISYADGLLARGLLKRIFVDECHTIITEAGFREKLGSLKGLYRYAKPVILLTATLPARLERWLRKVMVAGDAEIIRASTVKRNIRYEVVTVGGRTMTVEDAVAERAGEMVAAMTGDQKGIVYCRSMRACEELAAMLRCECHHSQMDEAAKTKALSTWADGKSASRWITATTGLGTGIDIRGITAVIHAGWPYGLVDFIQQTGRGGRRDGERVESVVVVERYPGWRNQHGSDIEHENREALDRFVNSSDCRRATIGSFMDGVGRECDVLGAERCDRCSSRRELFVDGFFRDRHTMNFGDEATKERVQQSVMLSRGCSKIPARPRGGLPGCSHG